MRNVSTFISSLVRPFLAVSAWVAVLFMLVAGRQVPGELWTLSASLTAYYFGERAARKTGEAPKS